MSRPKGVVGRSLFQVHSVRASTAGDSYLLADSGCTKATEYLGRQSVCLECPLEVCYFCQDNRGKGGRPKKK